MGKIDNFYITPEDFGFRRADITEIAGGNRDENASIALSLLRGATGPKRDIVVMNAILGYTQEYKAEKGDGRPQEALGTQVRVRATETCRRSSPPVWCPETSCSLRPGICSITESSYTDCALSVTGP
jgi:hypothetical protein